MSEHPRSGEKILRGIAVSGGVCRGKIVVLGRVRDTIPHREISEADVPQEIQRFEHALLQTRRQVLEVKRKVNEAMGAKDASIFDAHLLVLEDPTLIDEVIRLIQEQRVNAEHAFRQVAEKYAATLSSMDDEYLRERAADLRDVTARVLDILLGRTDETALHKLKESCIIISEDLSPSTTALLDKKMVLGFATDIGSKTSHTAIMARSLEIPAVVGLHDASKQLNTGQYVLLDGFNGLLVINPTDQTLFEYGQLVRKRVNLQERLRDLRDEPAITLDGARITLSANIEQAADAEHVRACGAEGVGLFRTEYLYLNRETLPTEEEQYQAYRQVAAALKPNPVVIRTLDLGGDKFISHLWMPQELNPFLGWRAIRFCLQERALFRAQLRAILRAAVEGNIKMMYPMISGLDELNQANALLEECRRELRTERIPFGEALETGAMIEIPSAVLTADSLAKRVKFLSIGTNDLIQYSLAVDRLNEKIAHLYEPTHPAIVRLIKATVEAGRRNGIWVGVCGEMAGDPALVPLLLGLDVDELSAAFSVVPQVKFLIRRLKLSEARQLADFALNCESGSEILARSQALARRIAPGLFENQD
ncbi:MAG: phosphoenolpyruvate--protein phosphotransferase [Verrucomicrobia bacterium]|nr:MAG: phosphoenolpyruvate--protein phosphotransferase [Verrucomicrobiota bacterium]